MSVTWNDALRSLALVRLGQELGTDSELAQSIAHTIDFAVRLTGFSWLTQVTLV
jgi:hypothetical protein